MWATVPIYPHIYMSNFCSHFFRKKPDSPIRHPHRMPCKVKFSKLKLHFSTFLVYHHTQAELFFRAWILLCEKSFIIILEYSYRKKRKWEYRVDQHENRLRGLKVFLKNIFCQINPDILFLKPLRQFLEVLKKGIMQFAFNICGFEATYGAEESLWVHFKTIFRPWKNIQFAAKGGGWIT